MTNSLVDFHTARAVGVEGREVDDRVRPDRDADERPAPPLVIGSIAPDALELGRRRLVLSGCDPMSLEDALRLPNPSRELDSMS